MRRLTLRAKLLLVVIAALVPIGALGIWQGLANRDSIRVLLDDQLVIGALAMAERQREHFIVAERSLLILSQNEGVRAMGPRCRGGLKPGFSAEAGVLNIIRSDASGAVRCSVVAFAPGLSLATQQWWREGIRRKAFIVSAPVLGPVVKRQVVIAMLPMFTAQGQSDGAVSMSIDFKQLQRSLVSDVGAIDENAGVAVFAQGQIVATSSRGELPQFKPGLAIGRVAEATSAEGVVWRYSAARIYGNNLYSIYAKQKPELSARATGLALDKLAMPILAIILTSLAIWIATHRLVVHWFESLIRLADKFAAGEYRGDPAYFENAPAEIAALSHSLHAMAGAIEQRDIELSAALLAKTNMTLEIHHRVKNNLQLVSSLLHLQSRQLSDPAARLALDQARARIGALAEIHRILFEGNDESEQGDVNLRLLLSQLCAQLRVLHRHQVHIKLLCDIQDHTVPNEVAIPLSLFSVEAITNAFRHAYTDASEGTIVLVCQVIEDEIRLSVIDQGVGFDRTSQFESTGSQLMGAFAAQLGGTFAIASSAGNGSEVTLRFPIERANPVEPNEATNPLPVGGA